MGAWSKKASTPRQTGQPLKPGQRDWRDDIADRLAVKAEREALNGPDDRTGKCTAHTTGKWGPKRPCDRWALLGAPVCYVHGATKLLREKAEQIILEETIPSIKRLRGLRDQDEDKKVALGAAVHLINRSMGEAGKGKGQSAPSHVVIVGVGLGGLPEGQGLTVAARKLLIARPDDDSVRDPMDDEPIEGEVVNADDEQGEDPLGDEYDAEGHRKPE